MCCVQLFSRLTSFRSTSIKPYFQPEDTYDVKPGEPEANVELDELEAPPSALEAPKELTEPIKPTIKRGQGRPRKHPTNENLVMENYITSAGISASSVGISASSTGISASSAGTSASSTGTSASSAGISARQSPHADISVLVQEAPFTDSRRKEINGLLKKSVFIIIAEKDVPQGVYIFNSRFVDEIKHPGTNKAFKKSRLVVQAYNN